MTLYLSRAGPAEIIRTVQKDLFFTNEVYAEVAELLRRFDNRLWLKYDNVLKISCQVFYHGLHAFFGLQTLGEEYTGIIQIDSGFRDLPGRIRQLTAVVLEFAGEAILLHYIRNFKREVDNSDELTPEAQKFFSRMLQLVEDVIPFLKAVHRGLFYLYGGKYQISKRLTGINYVLVRHWLKQNHSLVGYRILGLITLLQVLISLFVLVQKQQIAEPKRPSRDLGQPVAGSTRSCVLCLDIRTNTSATRCGHLFCWACIIEWLRHKNECPICREPLKASTVVRLQNYRGV